MTRLWRTILAGIVTMAVLMASWGSAATVAAAAPTKARPTARPGEVLTSVDVTAVRAAGQDVPQVKQVAAPKVSWPEGRMARVSELTPAAQATEVTGTPLRIGALSEVGKGKPVKVRPLEGAESGGLSGMGVGYLLEGEPDSALHVELDYAPFAKAVGADWSGRLRWVAAPACVLERPDAPECQQVRLLDSRNDTEAQTVSADVTLTDGSVVVMAAGAPTSAGGDFTATGLSSASSWTAGGQSGGFSWSYPMRTPPMPGGLAPGLSLSYSSEEADGRTSGSNNQPSWLGEGFDIGVGFIERKYVSCSDEVGTSGANNTQKTGDLCWLTDSARTNDAKWDNATLSLAGHSGELVRIGNSAVWRLKADDGTRVEKLGTAGAASGESWKVTITDGTQYFFGKGASDGQPGTPTNSVWTVPVAGNHAGEPARASSFGASFRSVPWRWNLDYVVSPHGDSMTYYYAAESNKYKQNLSTVTSYTRGGHLTEIRYGERRGVETATPAGKVTFTVDERCFDDGKLSNCASATPTATNAYHWPDVPVDSICTGTTCAVGQVSPTFFTRKRLAQINTFIRNAASGYDPVDRWVLTAGYPDSGDGSPNALWLEKVQHLGLGGGSITLPETTFTPSMMVNRVTGLNYGTPLTRARLTTIKLESGGKIEVGYQASDCTSSSLPTPATNGKRCFPAYYSENGSPPTLQWFNKYVVKTVLEQDTAQVVDQNNQVSAAGAVAERTTYTYQGAPAWRYDDSLLTPAKYRTWNIWRGFEKVVTAVGDPGSTQTVSEALFFRGMNGDKTATSATKSVSVTDSTGATWPDEDHLAGAVRESRQLTAASGGSELSGAIHDPYVSGPTANDGRSAARVVDVAESRSRQNDHWQARAEAYQQGRLTRRHLPLVGHLR
ncbi:MAG: hypothetical protein QM708_10545 [Propioniciclava sp.]|uniref:hypothetical protein n=1 Tax=Propioniciclava sp. TaxID=2038686 RepID=UPI0039E66F62